MVVVTGLRNKSVSQVKPCYSEEGMVDTWIYDMFEHSLNLEVLRSSYRKIRWINPVKTGLFPMVFLLSHQQTKVECGGGYSVRYQPTHESSTWLSGCVYWVYVMFILPSISSTPLMASFCI